MRSSRSNKAGGAGSRPQGGERGGNDGAGWIWGMHAGLAALANPKRRIERIVVSRNAQSRLPQGLKADVIEPDAIDRMLPPGAVHQGLAVRVSALPDEALEDVCQPVDGRCIVVLDQVTDPQNVGALYRSAAAFGARAMVMQDRKSPPLTGALAKAAAGAIEIVPEVRVVNIARAVEQLGEMGYRTIGLSGEGRETLESAAAGAAQVALVLGAEGKGLRPLVAERCHHLARIDINPAMESLNVSTAAAIALYATRTK